MSKKLLVLDADTILYSSSAQQQDNKCLVTNTEYGSQRLFDSKTAFNDWAKEHNRKKEVYTFETISSVIGEPRFAFQSVKQKVEKIFQQSGCDDFIICIEGEGNFRKDYDSNYVSYKSNRTAKPLLFQETVDFVLKKYKNRVVLSEGRETDDTVNIYAWEGYLKSVEAISKDASNIVIGYCDKDLAANSRGWLLNYNKLEQGVLWNDTFTQSYNFAVQLLIGDSADTIPGIEKLHDSIRFEHGIKVKGVGKATADKILKGCSTPLELAKRVRECYEATYPDDWLPRLSDNGFFLYLLRHGADGWCVDEYIRSGLQ